jgi:isocitrate dehydrogenase
LSTKHHRKYDGRFKDIFEELFSKQIAAATCKDRLRHRLIDGMVASALK